MDYIPIAHDVPDLIWLPVPQSLCCLAHFMSNGLKRNVKNLLSLATRLSGNPGRGMEENNVASGDGES